MMEPIETLLAIEEIRQLKARYFRLLDERDYDGMAQVFCTDAVFDCTRGAQILPVGGDWSGPESPVTSGRDAIMAWISSSFANRTCVHHGHCHEVTIDSATEAHGVIAMQDQIFALDRTTLILQASGQYHERYRIEAGAWRIAHTRLTRFARVQA